MRKPFFTIVVIFLLGLAIGLVMDLWQSPGLGAFLISNGRFFRGSGHQLWVLSFANN